MNRQKIFCDTIFSEIMERKCSVNTEVLPSGAIELHGHILVNETDAGCEVLYCNSRNDLVEIAAVVTQPENWNAETGLKTIPNYFHQFRGNNVVPVYQWKPDWSIIQIQMDDFMEAIDYILS